MRRPTAVPILAVAFALACDSTTTDPNRAGSDGLRPSFQEGPSDVECRGTLPPGTYQNVVVPEGQVCVFGLGKVIVLGNVKALEGSELTISGKICNEVRGNIEADKATDVLVQGVTVDGNIVMTEVTGVVHLGGDFTCGPVILTNGSVHILKSGSAVVTNVDVQKGNLKVEENGSVAVLFTSVAQGFQASKNGPVRIFDSGAGHDLQVF
jgi:hypothetical protein